MAVSITIQTRRSALQHQSCFNTTMEHNNETTLQSGKQHQPECHTMLGAPFIYYSAGCRYAECHGAFVGVIFVISGCFDKASFFLLVSACQLVL